MPTSARGIFNAVVSGGRARGFTLIEVLVVLLILGIAVSGASLGLTAIERRDTELAVRRLQRVLEVAAARAQTLGQIIEFEILANGYRFNRLDVGGHWVPLDEPPWLVAKDLPPGLAWRALVQASGEQGRVRFGIFAPRYALSLNTPEGVVRLRGQATGAVIVERSDERAQP